MGGEDLHSETRRLLLRLPQREDFDGYGERLGYRNLGSRRMPAPCEHAQMDKWGQSRAEWLARERRRSP